MKMKYTIILIFGIIFFWSCVENKNETDQQKEFYTETDSVKNDVVENNSEATVDEEEYEYDEYEFNEACLTELHVYLNDPDTTGSNIRSSPGGNIISTLHYTPENFVYFITAYVAHNGWIKIDDLIRGMDSDIKLPSNVCWIHGSILSVDTRNYGGEIISVYAESDRSSIVINKIEKEMTGLTLLDLCGNWAEVEWTEDEMIFSGWIEIEWLCGNPLTNCS